MFFLHCFPLFFFLKYHFSLCQFNTTNFRFKNTQFFRSVVIFTGGNTQSGFRWRNKKSSWRTDSALVLTPWQSRYNWRIVGVWIFFQQNENHMQRTSWCGWNIHFFFAAYPLTSNACHCYTSDTAECSDGVGRRRVVCVVLTFSRKEV